MPMYEYKCQECGKKFEELIPSVKSEILPRCPLCGSDNTRKQFSTFAASVKSSSSAPPSCATGGCGSGFS